MWLCGKQPLTSLLHAAPDSHVHDYMGVIACWPTVALGLLWPPQAHEYLLMVIDTISKEEVDALAKSLLSYLSHYNQEQKVGAQHCGVNRVGGAVALACVQSQAQLDACLH